MSWKLIRDKSIQSKAEQMVSEIAEAIITIPVTDINSIGLMSGRTGIALFLFYAASYFSRKSYYDQAEKLLESVFDEINNGRVYHSFAGGLAGIGWTIVHLNENNFINVDDPVCELDDYLNHIMVKEIEKGNYDYLHGALGIALYFFQNLNSRRRDFLLNLIDLLEKIAEQDDKGGYRWPSENMSKANEKGYNLGLIPWYCQYN
jgi:lantibiotic modifying enzyme